MSAIRAAAILVAVSLAGPVFAGQHQRRGGGTDAQPAERAVPRDQGEPKPAAPAAEPARRGEPERREAQRGEAQRGQAQRTEPRRSPEPQRAPDTPRAQGSRRADRSIDRAVPRTEPYRGADNRSRGNRPVVVTPRYYDAGRYYAPPYRGYRPYFFRPQMRLGSYAIYLGYPVPYAYSYAYPVPVYGYGRPATPVRVGPGSPYYGGVSLELSPGDADVYVDGWYAGWVEDFDGTMQPLTLAAGTHRIEVIAPGYEPLVLDVFVRAGEVVPYRGSLVPGRY